MSHVYLMGEVGVHITAREVADRLEALPAGDPFKVFLSSAGGDLQEAISIFNLLRSHERPIEVEITGWALSAGSVIAMAGDTVKMHENALLMIHAPWTTGSGNARDLRETAEALDVAKASMVSAYTRRGIPRVTVERWLSGEQDHWFTADEAKTAGLVDTVIEADEPLSVQNCPFKIPESVLEKLMTNQPKPKPQTTDPKPHTRDPKPQPQAAGEELQAIKERARAEALEADYKRRADIERRFQRFMDRPGIPELMQACLSNPNCDPQYASDRILEHIGKGVEPIQGTACMTEGFGPADFHASAFGMPSMDQRLGNFKNIAEDYILTRAGLPVEEPHPAVEAGDLRGKSIVDIAERILSMTGKTVHGTGPSAIIKAAMTTSDFPNLLGSITGRALRMGYDMAPATHAIWTADREVADFRTQTLLQLSEAPGLEKVNEGAEYTFGAFSESAETFAVETYGKIVSLTRQALINDDLNAFTRIPAAFGASARRKEADLVYAKLTGSDTMSDGLTLFHTDHGNLASSGAALSVASLGAARAAMRTQKGIAGLDFIDPAPRFLIVPVALETTAEELLSSLVDPSKSNDTGNPQWIRGLTLVADPRLDADSTTAWYLAASPTTLDTIVRAYLAGEARPHVEENDEFVRDAISFKNRLDFGVGVVDWRGLYKNPGA
ncbi:MAG: ClpP-like prohead protease/major capsid protein fusion protein [Methylohalobius sp. ZOD2]